MMIMIKVKNNAKLMLATTILASLSVGALVAFAAQPLREFKDLLSTAKTLESAEMLLSTRPERLDQQRNELLYLFAREIKSVHSDKFFSGVTKKADEYRIKATSFMEENKKGKSNWFMNFMPLGGPLGSMKGLSKNEAFLGTLTERYETQAKSGILTQTDIECDMIRYQVRALHAIMFILQTDIKYLMMEKQQILNRAIFEQLKADKFVSSVNFYEINHLTDKQRVDLLHYFADRVDTSDRTVGDAVDHFYNPGQYIIGRLLDSCQTAIRYEEQWRDHQTQHDEVCPTSTSDPNGRLFPEHYKFNKYDDLFAFCNTLLDAL